jgi:thiamine-monophosphate kinase
MSEMGIKRTELADLGEFGVIKRLTSNITISNMTSIKGVGDDAAVIERNKTEHTLLSTDMLVEGVHFDLGYVPLKHLGYKAVVVNVSDICAMNGQAEQITVSLALSNRFSMEAIEELYEGMIMACDHYNVDLVGGDTTSSSSGLVISISVLGSVPVDRVTYRNTAKEKDLLVVTGDLGAAYMGLQILEREKSVFEEAPTVQPDLAGHDYILARQLRPEARQDVVQALTDLDLIPTSMIDISDGLASELFHLTTQSNLGCMLYEAKIPIDESTYNAARDFDLDPTLCALSGGEDYELLLTISAEEYSKVENNPLFTTIGYMTDKEHGQQMTTKDGQVFPLEAQGWQHLKSSAASSDE